MRRRSRRSGIAGAVLAAALPLLASCQHVSLPGAVAPAAESTGPPVRPGPAPVPSDPVLAFVTRAAPGQATSLDDPVLGRVEVRLEREYYSADALYCRRFTVSAPAAIQTRVACRQPDGWRLDAILGQQPAR